MSDYEWWLSKDVFHCRDGLARDTTTISISIHQRFVFRIWTGRQSAYPSICLF